MEILVVSPAKQLPPHSCDKIERSPTPVLACTVEELALAAVLTLLAVAAQSARHLAQAKILVWHPVVVHRTQQAAQRKACLWHKRPYLLKNVAVDRLLWLLLHGS